MTDITSISNQQAAISRLNSSRSSTPATPAANSSNARGADSVELSDTANLLAKLRDMPDTRQDLIAQIRAEIANDSYLTDEKIEAAIKGLMDEFS